MCSIRLCWRTSLGRSTHASGALLLKRGSRMVGGARGGGVGTTHPWKPKQESEQRSTPDSDQGARGALFISVPEPLWHARGGGGGGGCFERGLNES